MTRQHTLSHAIGGLLALMFVALPPVVGQSWAQHPQVQPARTRTALAVVQGKLYVIGGQVTDTSCTRRVDIYDPVLKQWTQGADAPKPLCGHAVVVIGKTVYSFGGSDGNLGSDVVLTYDTVGDQWSTPPIHMPVPRTYHAAVLGTNGRVYLIGGQNSGAPLAQVDEFDPATGTWTKKTNLPVPRTHMAGTRRVCDGLIYVLAENSFQRFDPANNAWAVLADLPEARSGVALAAGPDDRLYAFGGFGGQPFESADTFIFGGSGWSKGPPVPTARGELSAVRRGNRIFTVGGSGKFPGIMGANEALGPIPSKLCPPRRHEIDLIDAKPLLCGWTAWLNRDRPSGSGDYETRADFVAAGSACESPRAIECRVRGSHQTWQQAGQVYACDPQTGGVCVNSKQASGAHCLDYEVRFCCGSAFDP